MSEYPTVLPCGVTPEYHYQYAMSRFGSEHSEYWASYWTFTEQLQDVGWTPVASANRHVKWVITLKGEKVKLRDRVVNEKEWGNRIEGTTIPDNLVCCTITPDMKVAVSSEAISPSFPMLTEPDFALRVPSLLQNPELLGKELLAALDTGTFDSPEIDSLFYCVDRLPDPVTVSCLTGNHLFPTGYLTALKVGSSEALIVAAKHFSSINAEANNTFFADIISVLEDHEVNVPAEQLIVCCDPEQKSVREGLRHMHQSNIALLVPHCEPETIALVCKLFPADHLLIPMLQDKLAENPHTPSDYLWMLACHPDPLLRELVVNNPNVSSRARAMIAVQQSG